MFKLYSLEEIEDILSRDTLLTQCLVDIFCSLAEHRYKYDADDWRDDPLSNLVHRMYFYDFGVPRRTECVAEETSNDGYEYGEFVRKSHVHQVLGAAVYVRVDKIHDRTCSYINKHYIQFNLVEPKTRIYYEVVNDCLTTF